jgi:lipid-binding SYLF domain-containing protein
MFKTSETVIAYAMATMVALGATDLANAGTAEDLDKDSRQALQTLSRSNPLAEELSHTAKAVLVFPNVIKAGLVFGGSYGEGELIEGPTVVVVDEGVARNLSTSSLQDDAYAFIFSQQGLMAGISIEGTKVTKIELH